MTSKPLNECECRKLKEFKEFLHSMSAAPDTPGQNGAAEMRQCMTRNNSETYPVTADEMQAEVIIALWNHLNAKHCPQDFQLALLHAAINEIESERKNIKTNDIPTPMPTDYANSSHETIYDLIKLQKFALNNLEKLVTRLTDNTEATNLQNYAIEGSLCAGEQCVCAESSTAAKPRFYAAAVKNKPRKMEDRHCCLTRFSDIYQLKSNSHKYGFYGVFDGHGGSLAATFAAAHLPHLVAERLKQADDNATERLKALTDSFLQVDQMFTRKRISSGTTAVCILHRQAVDFAQLYVAWVGDSRAMLVSNKNKHKQLVRPHKPDCPEERKRIESNDSGAVLFVHGHWRVNGILNVSRSIGDFSVSSVIAEPDVVSVDLTEENDFLVIGTDGFWDYVLEEDVISTIYNVVLNKDNNLEDLPKKLIDLAKRGDSQDNITVVIVFLRCLEKIIENYSLGKSDK